MKIYEIPYEMRKALDDIVVDEETGEIVDAGRLHDVEGEAASKIEATCLYLREDDADLDALKAEIDRLKARYESGKKRHDYLKRLTLEALHAVGGKVKTLEVTASIRHTKAVVVDEGTTLPEAYTTVKTTISPNKAAIKAALEAGAAIEGCRIVENESLSIR